MFSSMSILNTVAQRTSSPKLTVDQKNGFLTSLVAAEKKETLSVELIKKIHSALTFTPTPKIPDSKYKMPDLTFTDYDDEERPDLNYPGKFRQVNVGTSLASKDEEYFTKKGLVEIIDIIRTERDKGFPAFKSTNIICFNEKQKYDKEESFDSVSLARQQGSLSNQEFADNLFQKIQKKSYVIFFPRTDNENTPVDTYINNALEKLVKEFNSNIEKTIKEDDKINLIVGFLKNALRLHPFRDNNHRTLAFGLLNFLLLREGIGLCPLTNRRQFVLNGLDESISAVKKELISYAKLSADLSPSKTGLFSSLEKSTESKLEASTVAYEKLTVDYKQEMDDQSLQRAKLCTVDLDSKQIDEIALTAATKGYVRTLNYLLATKKIDPNKIFEIDCGGSDTIRTTLLLEGLMNKQKGIAKMLVEKNLSKENINKFYQEMGAWSSSYHGNALIYSIIEGDLELTKNLLQKGADPYAKEWGGYESSEFSSPFDLAKTTEMDEPLRAEMIKALSTCSKAKPSEDDCVRSENLRI